MACRRFCSSSLPTRRDAGRETAGAMEGRGGHRGVRAKGFPPAEGREPPAPPARHAEFLSKSYVPSASSPTPGDVPRSERETEASTSTSWAGQLWKQYDPINRLIFPGVGVPATYDDRGAPPRAARDPSRSDRGGSGSDRGVRVLARAATSPQRDILAPLSRLTPSRPSRPSPQGDLSSASSRCATWCTRPSW